MSQTAATADFYSFSPTPVNGILINSKNRATTWKRRNEVFYAACNLRRAVWVFGWYNQGGRFTSRHKRNRSAFVCRRCARGQMKRLLRNNRADVKHCGFAAWDRKWRNETKRRAARDRTYGRVSRSIWSVSGRTHELQHRGPGSALMGHLHAFLILKELRHLGSFCSIAVFVVENHCCCSEWNCSL